MGEVPNVFLELERQGMRGTYRLRLLSQAVRKRWLKFQADRAVRRFPTIAKSKGHALSGSLIVTLTSYPPRFPHLAKTLRSLLDQSISADRTILWLAAKDINALPDDVLSLKTHGLEIRSTRDIKSYKKLIPALELWPNAHFVTADDDVYYPPDWLENLANAAADHPGEVIAGRAHLAHLNERGMLRPYSCWQLASDLEVVTDPIARFFPTGVGGVLYPPGAFNSQVTNSDLFTRLAPRGDDIWFFWMSRMAGTKQRRIRQWFDVIEWPSTQDVALAVDNLHGDGNDRQIQAMEKHFGPVP